MLQAADVRIPPRAVVKFKPGKEMREAVLQLTPKDEPSGKTMSSNQASAQPQTSAARPAQP